jgi:O-antigen ligase
VSEISKSHATYQYLVPASVFASIFGFLGLYTRSGFASFPPIVVLALQLGLLSLAVVLLRPRLRGMGTASWLLVLAATWMALTLLWTNDPATVARRWLLVLVPGLLLFWAAYADPRANRTLAWTTWLLSAVTIASALFSLAVHIFGYGFNLESGAPLFLIDLGITQIGALQGGRQFGGLDFYLVRYSGFTSNPNGLGLFAALALVALTAQVGMGTPRRNKVAATLAVLCAVILLANASRAGIGAALAGLAMVTLLRLRWRRAAGALVAAGALFPVVFYLLIIAGGTSSAPGSLEAIEIRERAMVWPIALDAARSVWATGVGFGLTQEFVFEPLGIESSAHSVFLSLLIETGVIGLAIAVGAWLLPIAAATRVSRMPSAGTIACAALLLTLFIHQTVDSAVFRFNGAHFIFVYLLGAGIGFIGRDRAQSLP